MLPAEHAPQPGALHRYHPDAHERGAERLEPREHAGTPAACGWRASRGGGNATVATLASTCAAALTNSPACANAATHAVHQRALVALAVTVAATSATASPPSATPATTSATTSSWYCRHG